MTEFRKLHRQMDKKMNEISRKVPAKVSISDLIEKHATSKQLEYGYDLADYIIDNSKKKRDIGE